ncbi:MAG: hypothetical protein ACI861_002273 [Paracoccaceae bacterium]|jgi:uncharacterized protein
MRILLFLMFLWPVQVIGQEFPDRTNPYVNDFAGILDAPSEARITGMLKAVRQDRDIEMIVVTMMRRLDYGNSPSMETFATNLFNHWGIGDAERNDGILILVLVDDREMRIELGAGYPASFDDRVKRVIDHHFIPWFKQSDCPNGIEAGVSETIKRTKLDGETMVVGFGSRLKETGYTVRDSTRSGGLFAWIFGALGIAGLGGGAFGLRRHLRNKPRICDICDRKMVRLSEQSDDAWLAHGQKVEESLKSKDYDVWYCRRDDHVLIEGYNSWFSSFSACPNCDYRTLHSNRTVLTSATTSSTGRARVDYNCRNCDHSYTEHVTIARVSKSSSSSGSSGGGSSSGGGASGSW